MTVYLGSVFRAILTVTRTGFIWAANVCLFYSPLGKHPRGAAEPHCVDCAAGRLRPHLLRHRAIRAGQQQMAASSSRLASACMPRTVVAVVHEGCLLELRMHFRRVAQAKQALAERNAHPESEEGRAILQHVRILWPWWSLLSSIPHPMLCSKGAVPDPESA